MKQTFSAFHKCGSSNNIHEIIAGRSYPWQATRAAALQHNELGDTCALCTCCHALPAHYVSYKCNVW